MKETYDALSFSDSSDLHSWSWLHCTDSEKTQYFELFVDWNLQIFIRTCPTRTFFSRYLECVVVRDVTGILLTNNRSCSFTWSLLNDTFLKSGSHLNGWGLLSQQCVLRDAYCVLGCRWIIIILLPGLVGTHRCRSRAAYGEISDSPINKCLSIQTKQGQVR